MKSGSADVLLLKSDIDCSTQWVSAFAKAMPDLEVRVWPDVGKTNEINLALLWHPPPELFKSLNNLEVIFSAGAGIDHLIDCPTLPTDVPIVRMIDPALTAGMVEYVLFHVIRFHRRMDLYEQQQRRHLWNVLPQCQSEDICVGLMGMGILGAAVANALCFMGYEVRGWSRTEKVLHGVTSFVGPSDLSSFLESSQILVLLLPLTSSTMRIIDARRLGELPEGACVINAGRGNLIVEEDLLDALNSGHISAAALDVFEVEPMLRDHPNWENRRIFVTPHIASITYPHSAATAITRNIERYREGIEMEGLVEVTDYE
uniref:Phosphoglycerate dehydrogenase and related dehydrogenases n=1 Tax=uncultured gamma proteobacterium HF0200_24F15 TaxID=723570 RepID=E7C3Y8_9GAMM|nr:phosphoglycerate dehydrogenase and related dehydrogenases [uncultured gamma proteobacterium HF0200_24F15]